MTTITPELVANALRSEIADRRVVPGAPLRQEELAARFGVSRIPVREALRQLEAEGIVVVQPNRGAFVRTFTAKELREIYDLRILLETDLLRRAVRKMQLADLDQIRAEAEAAPWPKNASGLRAIDMRFHLALYEPAGRPLQLAMVMKLRDSIAHYAPAEDHMRRLSSDWMDDHRQIAEACERGDRRQAVRILRHHLEVAAELTLGRLQRDPAREEPLDQP